MKTFSKILITLIFLVLINSCTDIADLGDNTVKNPILPSISKEDSLAFLENSNINFGDIVWHRVWLINAVLRNNSDVYTVVIYDIKLKNNYGFELYPEKGFPVVIPPLTSNTDNQFIARWNTNLVTPGYYKDTVFMNGSQQFFLFMEGNVTN